MSIFDIGKKKLSPVHKAIYDAEKKVAQDERAKRQDMEAIERVRAKARTDALPPMERAKARLQSVTEKAQAFAPSGGGFRAFGSRVEENSRSAQPRIAAKGAQERQITGSNVPGFMRGDESQLPGVLRSKQKKSNLPGWLR